MPRNRMKPEERASMAAKVIELWEQDLTDPEISRELGCSVSTVCRIRHEEDLPSNYVYPLNEGYPGERLMLYNKGLNDYEIARRQGVTSVSILGWRRRLGLPPNCQRGKRGE